MPNFGINIIIFHKKMVNLKINCLICNIKIFIDGFNIVIFFYWLIFYSQIKYESHKYRIYLHNLSHFHFSSHTIKWRYRVFQKSVTFWFFNFSILKYEIYNFSHTRLAMIIKRLIYKMWKCLSVTSPPFSYYQLLTSDHTYLKCNSQTK